LTKIVAGVDSSTQSVKVVLCNFETGEIIKQFQDHTQMAPKLIQEAWWSALQDALKEAETFGEISAISIGGQQHGMVLLDAAGEVIRPALLWNDTRSSETAEKLNKEFPIIAELTGSQLVASFTASKVLWVTEK
jgi:xylulokinase